MKFLLLAALLILPFSARAEEALLRVAAASSLTESMTKIAAAAEKQGLGKVELVFGSSNLLARQIEEGARVDIFFSADEAVVDALEKKKLLLEGTNKDVLGNSLVVIVANDKDFAIKSGKRLAEAGIKRVVLGNPKSVPAGKYAQQWLEKLNVWQDVSPKVTAAENVRAALAVVEAGNADAGIVYKTDAIISKKVKIALQVPAEESPVIRYSVAVTAASKEQAKAKKWLEYLEGAEAKAVFEGQGFTVLPKP